jgi:hypothetical protein
LVSVSEIWLIRKSIERFPKHRLELSRGRPTCGIATMLPFAVLLMGIAPGAFAQKQSAPTDADNTCDLPVIKKVVLDSLNKSEGFRRRQIALVDFQNVKTLGADQAKNTIYCRGVLVASSGPRFSGTLTLVPKGNKMDIDWFDDDAKEGLASFSGAGSGMPVEEAEFIKAMIFARNAFETAKTEFAKGATRPQRAKAICAALKSVRATNWIGKVTRLTTNGDGKGVLAIEISPNVKIKTYSTQLSDIGSRTLIEPDSELYSALASLSEGDQIKFSGSFLSKSADCFEESSLTMDGSMTSPEFIMRFANVQKTSY